MPRNVSIEVGDGSLTPAEPDTETWCGEMEKPINSKAGSSPAPASFSVVQPRAAAAIAIK